MRDSLVKQGLFGLFVCVFFVLSIGVSSYSQMSRVLTQNDTSLPGVTQYEHGIMVNTALYHLAATKDGMAVKPLGNEAFWGLRFSEPNSIFSRVDHDPMLLGIDRMLIPHASLVEDVYFNNAGFSHSLVIPSLPVDKNEGVFVIEGNVLSSSKTNVNTDGDWEWDLDSMKLAISPYRVLDADGSELPATVSLDGETIHIVIPSSALLTANYPVRIF